MARGPQGHGVLLRDITLTDGQKVQVQEQQARMTQARDAGIAAIRSILTAGQRVQFDRNVAAVKERMEKRQAGMR